MASHGKLQQVFLVIFLVAFSIASTHVEARDGEFFTKMTPVRRYSQFFSSSKPALAPLASIEATPTPAPAPTPALSEVETASENYVYGFYNKEVGKFPMATTTEANAKAVKKMSSRDDFMKEDAKFNSQDENERYSKFNNYENEYTSNHQKVNQYHDFQRGYRRNNNFHNYHKYTRRNNDNKDNMYTTNYNTVDDNMYRYIDKNKFKREKPSARTIFGKRLVNNGRYYNDNVGGYYKEDESANQYYPTEQYEGVYLP